MIAELFAGGRKWDVGRDARTEQLTDCQSRAPANIAMVANEAKSGHTQSASLYPSNLIVILPTKFQPKFHSQTFSFNWPTFAQQFMHEHRDEVSLWM